MKVSEAVSNVMRANKSSGTKLEFAALEVLGVLDFILVSDDRDCRHVFGCVPDLVHRQSGIVVFVHGCFWHACPLHFKPPKSNVGYWVPKMVKNRKRDARNAGRVRRAGWSVLTFWEHDFRDMAGRNRVCARAVRKIFERCDDG